MSRITSLLAFLAAAIVVPMAAVSADEQPGPESTSGTNVGAAKAIDEETPAKPPIFVPPKRGAPLTRAGAATRGVEVRGNEDAIPVTWALAPQETGLTNDPQPTFYWYLSGPTESVVEFGVVVEDSGEVVAKANLPGPFAAGIQPVRLADHGANLEPGVHYLWYVALVVDPADRTHDRMAAAGVEYVAASPELAARLSQAGSAQAAHVLAEAGIWYDALDALNTRIALQPDDARLAEHRSALLEQVGLHQVASAPGNASAPVSAK